MTRRKPGKKWRLRRADGRVCNFTSSFKTSSAPWAGRTYTTACGEREKVKAGTKPETKADLTCLACIADGGRAGLGGIEWEYNHNG